MRLSLLSTVRLRAIRAALAHLAGPPLPAGHRPLLNQGFFDVQLRIRRRHRLAPAHLDTRKAWGPKSHNGSSCGSTIFPRRAGASAMRFRAILAGPRSIRSWYERGVVVREGRFCRRVCASIASLFLLCLVARSAASAAVLTVVAVFIGLQALTLDGGRSGSACRASTSAWLPALLRLPSSARHWCCSPSATSRTPSLRRRWFIAAAVGRDRRLRHRSPLDRRRAIRGRRTRS